MLIYAIYIFFCFKAGLLTKQLTIALEPEAASIFCRHLRVDTAISGGDISIAKMPVGTRYMVLDAGGIEHFFYFKTLSQRLKFHYTLKILHVTYSRIIPLHNGTNLAKHIYK
jgi:hypothetical protein